MSLTNQLLTYFSVGISFKFLPKYLAAVAVNFSRSVLKIKIR